MHLFVQVDIYWPMVLTISTSSLQNELIKLKDNYFVNFIIYADDFLIYAKEYSLESHNKVVKEVFEKLQKISLKACREKFQRASKKVVFLGIKPTFMKSSKSSSKKQSSTNIKELRDFFDLVNC